MLFHGHTMNNTIWNNTEIWGCNQVFEKRGKKKGNGHRRVKTRFCGGRNGIVPRGFSIWPPEEVIFKDIRFFLMVINIFLAILFNVFYLFCVDKNLQGLFLQIWPWGWTTSLLVHHNIIEEFHKDRWRKGEIKLGRQKKKIIIRKRWRYFSQQYNRW